MKEIANKMSFMDWIQKGDQILEKAYHNYIDFGEVCFNVLGEAYSKGWQNDKKFCEYLKKYPLQPKQKPMDVYCQWRWGYSRAHTRTFVNAYRVVQVIKSENMSSLPANLRVTMTLIPYLDEPEKLIAYWKEAVETASNKRVTSSHMAEMLDRKQAEIEAATREKEEAIAILEREKDVIEIKLEVVNDPDWSDEVQHLGQQEEPEGEEQARIREANERAREEFILRQEVSEQDAVKHFQELWEAYTLHYSLWDKKRLAKFGIQFLLKAFPQLNDEGI